MKRLILLLIALFTLNSCYRKPLYDDCVCDNYARIPISVDWEPSGVPPKNVSVLVYDRSSGDLVEEFIYEHNTNNIQYYIYLQIGEYVAVVFNELRNQIDYMSVDGYENFNTLKFYANNDSRVRARSVGGNDDYIQQPGGLAVQVIDDLDVTAELVKYTNKEDEELTKASEETRIMSNKLMGLIPTRKTVRLSITMHVDMIKSALMPALVDLRNVSEGYYVSGDKNSLNAKTVQFTMNNRTYDEGSDENGYISADIVLFGTLGERLSTTSHTDDTPLTLDALFALTDADKTIENRKVDITDIVEFTDHGYSGITLKVDCRADALPEVVPVAGEDSGFDTKLEDWETIDVPLIL